MRKQAFNVYVKKKQIFLSVFTCRMRAGEWGVLGKQDPAKEEAVVQLAIFTFVIQICIHQKLPRFA